MAEPMTSFVDLDSTTFRCPCGASVSGEGESVVSFLRAHASHCDGTVRETITDDGMRCLADDTPRTRTYTLRPGAA